MNEKDYLIKYSDKIINLSGRFTPESFFYFDLYGILTYIFPNGLNSIKGDEYTLSFDMCEFLCPNALVILGVIDAFVKKYDFKLNFDFSSITNYEVYKFILNSGFASYVEKNLTYDDTNRAKFDKMDYNILKDTRDKDLLDSKYDKIKGTKNFKWFDIQNENTEEIFDYIKEVVKLIPFEKNEELEVELASKFYEIIINAYHHSESRYGLFSCAYYFEMEKVLHLAIYDFGKGIHENVSMHLSEKISAVDALKWAFTDGNTTKREDYPRGLGLGLLKSLVELNDGELFIYSGEGICRVLGNNTMYEEVLEHLPGTLFYLRVNTDSAKYILTGGK